MGRGGGDINFLPLKRVGPLERDLFEKGGGGGGLEGGGGWGGGGGGGA